MFAIKVESGVMKVGNSLVMSLPVVLVQNYFFKKGEKVSVYCTDDGIFIPRKSGVNPHDEDGGKMPVRPWLTEWKNSLARENVIIGLVGLGLFICGFYLLITNFEGMLNSVLSQDQISSIIAIVFGLGIIFLISFGLLFIFASLGAFEYKQQSRVKIYKGIQSEERVIDEATE